MRVGIEVALYAGIMITTRWFAYILLLAVAFAIGLLGTMSASRALTPATTPSTPTTTTPTVTTPVVSNHIVEC